MRLPNSVRRPPLTARAQVPCDESTRGTAAAKMRAGIGFCYGTRGYGSIIDQDIRLKCRSFGSWSDGVLALLHNVPRSYLGTTASRDAMQKQIGRLPFCLLSTCAHSSTEACEICNLRLRVLKHMFSVSGMGTCQMLQSRRSCT